MPNSGRSRSKQKCYLKLIRVFWAIFPHAFLVFSLALYSIIGAFIFTSIEGSRNSTNPEYDTFLSQLWNLSESSCARKEDPYVQDHFENNSKKLIEEKFRVEWLQKAPEEQWRFFNSLFFCCTVFTTVGYGNIFPVTLQGKIACMIYAAIGIPLMLLVLADLGDLLAARLSKTFKNAMHAFNKLKQNLTKRSLKKKNSVKSSLDSVLDSRRSLKEPLNLIDVLRSQSSVQTNFQMMRNIDIFERIIDGEKQRILAIKCNRFQRCYSCPELDVLPLAHSAMHNFDNIGEELDQLDVPVFLIVLIMFGYTMCGALILPQWETEWTYFNAFYFCFITLTTIGFGDIIPEHPNYFLLLSAYLVVGMAIVCMAFKLVQNRLVCLYKKCISCISGGKVTQYSEVISNE
ncbi:potassium channel subfamily K member 18 [Discoglossus pictus]